MKLKHIFENTPQRPKMSKQDVLAALKDFSIWTGPANWDADFSKEEFIRIDDRGLIHIDGALSCKKKMTRMPLQLESVLSLNVCGLETLEGLPREIDKKLILDEFMGSDLTMPAGNHVIMGLWQPELYLISCPNLTTLKGIENFISDNGEKIKIIIRKCENLAFDPYAYSTNYEFEFQLTIPKNIPLVKAIALTGPDQIVFRLLDSTLEEILNSNRGKQEEMPSLALELARAGYRGHAGLT